MSTIIKVDKLSKKYIIRHKTANEHASLRDVFTSAAKSIKKTFLHPISKRNNNDHESGVEDFWALKDVSFDINQGDRLGIIGRNGAGKSTLLKILSRITEPTSGNVSLKGRVASLLEVGTGFHPELTGRENIFLNGAILGMSKTEIRRKFDEIVAFSEVEKFLDTPVKRYSSGMYVRLAFAVAAHLEPDILIVDEVLAVGDAQFQKKCLGKLNEAGAEGRTVLFVSHNMAAIKTLCTKTVWLDGGSVVKTGLSDHVVSSYLNEGVLLNSQVTWEDPLDAPGNEVVRLHSAKITSDHSDSTGIITVAMPLQLEIEFWNYSPNAFLNISFALYDKQDICIFNSGSRARYCPTGKVKGVCHIPSDFLNDGSYKILLRIVRDQKEILIRMENILTFEVQDIAREGAWYGKRIGAVRPNFDWDIITAHDEDSKSRKYSNTDNLENEQEL